MQNSFATMREAEPLWIEVSPQSGIFTESIDPELFEYGADPLIIYQGTVRSSNSRDGETSPPFKAVRIEVRTKDYAEILALKAKFPLGWVEVNEAGAGVVIFARAELVSSMTQHLPLLAEGGLRIFLTLPLLETYAPGIYPLLKYSYRASTKTKST